MHCRVHWILCPGAWLMGSLFHCRDGLYGNRVCLQNWPVQSYQDHGWHPVDWSSGVHRADAVVPLPGTQRAAVTLPQREQVVFAAGNAAAATQVEKVDLSDMIDVHMQGWQHRCAPPGIAITCMPYKSIYQTRRDVQISILTLTGGPT